MRAAGIFSHLVLAFVCAGLTVLAFDGAPNPAGTPEGVAGAPPATDKPAVMTRPANDPAIEAASATAAPNLGHWAAPARPLDPAASTVESAQPIAAPTIAAVPLTEVAAVASAPVAAPAAAPVTVPNAAPVLVDASPVSVIPVPAPAADVAQLTPPASKAAPVATAAITSATSPAPLAATPPVTGAPGTAAVALPPPADPLADSHASGGTPGLKPAKALFGAVATPAPLAARSIGSYARGCLAGGQALPVDGETWQAMRLSRNRNWGHPRLIKLIEKLSVDGKQKDGWPGLLVGDIAQPRGGPMLTGHASHQIGLDADIWLTPMPDRRLSNKERETIEATSMLSDDGTTVNRDVWTEGHLNILKRAASYPDVERIFVHPAIKQVLCYAAKDDRSWLSKVRAYWGHHYHFHVRIHCPPGSADCAPQASVPGDDGCGTELDDWLKRIANIKPDPAPLPLPAPPPVASAKPKEKPPMTLDQLPQACSVVLAKDNPKLQLDIDAAAKALEAAKAAKLAEAATKAAAKTAADTAKAAIPPAMAAKSAKALSLSSPAVAKPVSVEKKSASQ